MSLPNPLPPNSVKGSFVSSATNSDGTTMLAIRVSTAAMSGIVQSQSAPHEPIVVIFD